MLLSLFTLSVACARVITTTESELRTSWFKDPSNVIRLTNGTRFVYDGEAESWFAYDFWGNVLVEVVRDLVPATSCFDNVHGGLGLQFEFAYELLLSLKNSVSGGPGLGLGLGSVSAFLGVDAGPSLSFSGTFTCYIERGRVGQLFLQPFYVSVPPMLRKKITVGPRTISRAPHGEVVAPMRLTAKQPPHHYCVTEPALDLELLQCDRGQSVALELSDLV